MRNKKTFKTLKVSEIQCQGKRQRPVDDGYAEIIKASIEETCQISPVLVRPTPNGKKKYQLVAGGHRHRAIELIGKDAPIECVVVTAATDEAALLEASENLIRNDLNPLDRAIAVENFRANWEKLFGKVKPGKDANPISANFALIGDDNNSVNLTELEEGASKATFPVYCAERMGLSRRAIMYSQKIAKNLPADLRQKLSGTAAADNQSLLLKFADLPPEKLKVAAKSIDTCKGDAKAALEALEGKKSVKPQTKNEQQFSKLFDAWARANAEVKAQFLAQAGLIEKPDEAIKNAA